jgi:flagellar hook assembly protein FlgD
LIPGQGITNVFILAQNEPNPFNHETTIRYNLSQASPVTLKIFDMTGRVVVTLVNETKAAGYNSVKWNGKDAQGKFVVNGIYFYRIQAGDFTAAKKMVLLNGRLR